MDKERANAETNDGFYFGYISTTSLIEGAFPEGI